MTNQALWGAPQWTTAASVALLAGMLALAWSYWRAPAGGGLRLAAATLKAVGMAALALCLVEPLLSGLRPRPGANLVVLAVDDSQSLQIHDQGSSQSRGAELRSQLTAASKWQTSLTEIFDVRRFAFDRQLRAVDDFSSLAFEGDGTALAAVLDALATRFGSLPVGGVLLFTDGNSTDLDIESVPWSEMPAVYPIVVGSDDVPPDISVESVVSSQTNFESAPVTVGADVRTVGGTGRSILARLLDEEDRVLEAQRLPVPQGRDVVTFRFQVRPTKQGVNFFKVQASDAEQKDQVVSEATTFNNERSVVVDRGGGPYRVLYVCGRPNWDFKFLRRALADDDQVELVGLVRIADREPKFTFEKRGERNTNQLFEGFHHEDEETAERYDEPVLLRLGTEDAEELRDGFPRAADELYHYDALVLDDVEAEFFSQDQLTLIESFVSRRGGGMLMAGGIGAFREGGYRRTPVGDMLPVYLDLPQSTQAVPLDGEFRLTLTREGWLQPWTRLRKNESEERQRLAAMAAFRTLNRVGSLKPGATELAQVTDVKGKAYAALVAQRYGRGRTAALLVGDLWRWGMRREHEHNDDLEKSWRQTVRWLVADVPQRVEVQVRPEEHGAANAMGIKVRVHDREYLPLENAVVEVQVKGPTGNVLQLRADASSAEAGSYVATHVSRTPGAYRALVTVKEPDGTQVGEREAGWVAQPLADEFNRLRPNRELLADIAERTGGQVVALDELDGFVPTLPSRSMPVTEPWIRPLWHHPMFFVFAVLCLVGEWGLRRWKGLA